jgi:hypothetical protein
MRVSRVVAERPSSRHSRTLSDYGNAIGIEILNGSGRACLAVRAIGGNECTALAREGTIVA